MCRQREPLVSHEYGNYQQKDIGYNIMIRSKVQLQSLKLDQFSIKLDSYKIEFVNDAEKPWSICNGWPQLGWPYFAGM